MRAEQRIPKLIRTPAAIRFLSCEPLLEYVDLSSCFGYRAIDWVIVGGESGSKARQFNLLHAEAIMDLCNRTGVACFMKQLGDNPVDGDRLLSIQSRHGVDMAEWPAWMRVQQFPVPK
jgi:protein gp37